VGFRLFGGQRYADRNSAVFLFTTLCMSCDGVLCQYFFMLGSISAATQNTASQIHDTFVAVLLEQFAMR